MNRFEVFINILDVHLQNFDGAAEILEALVHPLLDVGRGLFALLLDKVFDSVKHPLHLRVALGRRVQVQFGLPDNQDPREIIGVLKVRLRKVALPLVDHSGPLLVVECLFVLDHLRVGLCDDCDQEVHEDDEDVERAQDEHSKREQDPLSAESILLVAFDLRVVNQVEALGHVD